MLVRLSLKAVKIGLICSKFIFLYHRMNWSVSKFICTYHQSANWSVVSSSIPTPRRLNRSVSRFNLHCICIRELICSEFTYIFFTYFHELICSKFICILVSKPWTDLLVSSSVNTLRKSSRSVCRFNLHCTLKIELIC
jgi:hypothetical protein